ncbi:MAG: glucose 1-dehydrogenase, partial [Thaumarchaeota archaeon]|nr:glucose 1-dehydrogenase [Nitrososphaerota archaeon]
VKAIVVTPRTQNTLRVEEVQTPEPSKKEALLRVLRIGICGTDRDIISGFYGEAPSGSDFLILGHESICRIEKLGGKSTDFKVGDLVVPTVRRSCPENCLNCSNHESDMCYTGHYREHGIKQLHGFASEFAVSDVSYLAKMPESLVDVGVLLEPLTIVEKALVQTFALQTTRMKWKPRKALVLGAGPVGLLATAILRLQGLEVDTVATRSKESMKAKLVELTGANYINSKETPLHSLDNRYDIVFEITGNPAVALEAQDLIMVNGIVCYLGIYREEQETQNIGKVFTDLVLGNKLHFGSVNANLTYFERGAKDLRKIQRNWPTLLSTIITRKEKPENAQQAYSPESEEEIKTILEFSSS